MWLGSVGAQQSEVTPRSRRWVGPAREQQLEKCLWLNDRWRARKGDCKGRPAGPRGASASLCLRGMVLPTVGEGM